MRGSDFGESGRGAPAGRGIIPPDRLRVRGDEEDGDGGTEARGNRAPLRVLLTERSLASLRPPEGGRLVAWDLKLSGFGVVVGPKSVTFVAQRKIGRGRRTRRVKIGRWPTWGPEKAREEAREVLRRLSSGVDPVAARAEERARGTTVKEAVETHVAAMRKKGCSERSVEDVLEETRRYLSDWMSRPIAEISPDECARRHDRITERNGPYVANRVLRSFRAAYNTVARRVRDLPRNPTVGVSWNREDPRDETIPWTLLPEWRRAVDAIESGAVRDLWTTILFTGLRSEDARTIRWEDLDLERATLRRPNPKGGRRRAFSIPLSRFLLDLLRRRRDDVPPECPWAFPAVGRDGRTTHLRDLRAVRLEIGRRRLPDGSEEVVHPSPHRVRATFASACVAAGVSYPAVQALLNHSPRSGDVTLRHYVRLGVEDLRPEMEKVAGFLLERMGARIP